MHNSLVVLVSFVVTSDAFDVDVSPELVAAIVHACATVFARAEKRNPAFVATAGAAIARLSFAISPEPNAEGQAEFMGVLKNVALLSAGSGACPTTSWGQYGRSVRIFLAAYA